MLSRFSGDYGARLLGALNEQFVVAHDGSAAQALASAVTLRQLAAGESLILEEGVDNDLHFILAGAVDVVIKKRTIASRGAGLHVGEMALVDPRAPRSARVVATQTTVVATISEADFHRIADDHPDLWRRLAVELGNRLRERSKFILEPNAAPIIFVGSSKEALSVANRLRDGLVAPDTDVRIWSKGVFQASSTTIEDLEDQAQHADFAVLVASPDDVVTSRGSDSPAPRDNVLLELGLFMGALKRTRTFLLMQADAPLRLPSDLLGVTPLFYRVGRSPLDSPDVSEACVQILARVRKMGPK